LNVTRKNDLECTISGNKKITLSWLQRFLEVNDDVHLDTEVDPIYTPHGDRLIGLAIRKVDNFFEPTTQAKRGCEHRNKTRGIYNDGIDKPELGPIRCSDCGAILTTCTCDVPAPNISGCCDVCGLTVERV